MMIPWLAAACASITPGQQPTTSAQPTSTLAPTSTPASSLTPAQSDLDYLLTQIESTHPKPWHGIAREDWLASMHQLQADLPTLTPEQAYARLCELVTLLSKQGRDGHQFVIVPDDNERPALPFRTYEFAEGVYVTAAMPGYEKLVGRRITAIDGLPIADVLAELDQVVPRDGPQTVPGFRTIFLLRTSILRGLGLVGDGDVTVSVGGDGQPDADVATTPADWPAWRSWAGEYGIGLPERADTLYLSDPDTNLWWKRLPDAHALYIRYQGVRFVAPADAAAIQDAAADPGVTRVILDLRQNPGGDNHTSAPLYNALLDVARNKPGALYVMTDRLTFSAAANLSTQIEQNTDALFAGERMGGGLNFWDDVRWVELRNYPMDPRVGVSTRYWQFAAPDDPRLTIEPDISVPVTAADYFAGRDPALEAVLAH